MALLTEPNLSGRGKREDLADLISLVDARDTPFTSMARKGSKPGNMYFRWQGDSLPQPQVGGIVDGTDVQSSDYTNYVVGYRAELANYAQIFRRTIRVSNLTQDIADVAGVRDELADNVSKAITGIKRDMEATMTSNQTAQADNGSVPYLTAGIQTWINSAGTGTPTPGDVPSYLRTPSTSIVTGASSSLTDTMVQGLLKSIYDKTGHYASFDAIVGTDLKRAFTGLLGTTALTTTTTAGVTGSGATKVQTFQRDAAADTYIQAMDVFQGDFGTVRLHPTTFLGTISGSVWTQTAYKGLLLDMKLIELRYGGNVAQVKTLPDFGGGPARLIEAVAGLVCGNPLGLGKFDFSS
jgi:Family of unknown function (DUF5309)